MCCVCSPSSSFLCLSGVFLFGFGLVLFFCVLNMRFSLLVLFNCGVEASICVIFGG